MPAKLSRITPKFYTQHLEETRDFYESILSFSCIGWEPSLGWALFARERVEIMYTLPNDHLPFGGPNFTGSVYIYVVENIEDLWSELRSKVRVVYPLELFDYGMREFALYDYNGYMLQFGQESP